MLFYLTSELRELKFSDWGFICLPDKTEEQVFIIHASRARSNMGGVQYRILSLYSLTLPPHPPSLEGGTEVVVFISFLPTAGTHPP